GRDGAASGPGVGGAPVLLVLPLRISGVARVPPRQELSALGDLIDRSLDRLADPASECGSDLELRAAARRVDTAHQALVATVRPLRTPVLGRLGQQTSAFLATTSAAQHYARNLLLDASTRYADLDAAAVAQLTVARRQLAASIAAITTTLDPPPAADEPAAAGRPQYVRSASLFARIADTLPGPSGISRPGLALRDLQLLDGALARAAHRAGLEVTDLDTPPAA